MPMQQVQRPRVGLRRFSLVRPGQTALPYDPPRPGCYNTGPGYSGRFCRTLTPDQLNGVVPGKRCNRTGVAARSLH